MAIDISNYDFRIGNDTSASMNIADCKIGDKTISRFQRAQETVIGIAYEVAASDTNGIELFFFGGGRVEVIANQTPETIPANFNRRCTGGTPTAEVVSAMASNLSEKPTLCIIQTDGVPDSNSALREVLTGIANGNADIKFCFIQVGHDADATKFLKELNDLPTSRDIVSVITIDEAEKFSNTEAMIKAMLEV